MIKETKCVHQIIFTLIVEFLDGEMTAKEFRKQYFKNWKKYRNSDEMYEINKSNDSAIDRIFTALDCYCEDEELLHETDLNEQMLIAEIVNIIS